MNGRFKRPDADDVGCLTESLQGFIAEVRGLRIELAQCRQTRLMEPVSRPGHPGNATLLGTRKVAEVLGVHPRTVRRWRDQGELPTPLVVSGMPRWRRSEIEAWIQSQRDPK